MVEQKPVVLITGASRGIGRAIADTFVQKGGRLAITYQSTGAKETLETLFGEHNPLLLSADVAKEKDAVAAVAKTIETYGRIDVLVNNAGITADGLSLRMSSEDFCKVLDTNLTGAFYMSREVARHMSKARSGRIIFISSVVGLHGNPGQINYASAKAGVIGMMKTLALELGKRQITVNAIAPGFIETPMTDALSEDVKNHHQSRIPLMRFGQAEDVAAAVAFLASEEASYITGQVLSVDGGMNI